MKIGFLGLGKLGLPVALAVESKGHQVMGTDIDDSILWAVSHIPVYCGWLWSMQQSKRTEWSQLVSEN